MICRRRYDNTIFSNKVRLYICTCLLCVIISSRSNIFVLFCHASFCSLLYPFWASGYVSSLHASLLCHIQWRANLLISMWLYQLCSEVPLHINDIALRVCSLTTALNQNKFLFFFQNTLSIMYITLFRKRKVIHSNLATFLNYNFLFLIIIITFFPYMKTFT